jgi:hypothetical protein
MAARTFVPASDRRPADLRRAINAQIGLLTADQIRLAFAAYWQAKMLAVQGLNIKRVAGVLGGLCRCRP